MNGHRPKGGAMGSAKNPPQSGTCVHSPATADQSYRARAFLLSFAVPGQRNRPADLVLRALVAIAAAFRDFAHEQEPKP